MGGGDDRPQRAQGTSGQQVSGPDRDDSHGDQRAQILEQELMQGLRGQLALDRVGQLELR